MVEISKSGSGEGFGWATGRGYSTIISIGVSTLYINGEDNIVRSGKRVTY